MFDAKNLLDLLVRGNAQQPQGQPAGGLDDLLRNIFPGAAQGPGTQRDSEPASRRDDGGDSAAGNPLGDLLGKLQQQAGQGTGGIADILGQVFGQATSGVREGAGRLDDATGASARLREAMGQMTGRSPEDLLAQLKELMANNQMGTGAALGGLGALILGTGAGRSLAASAARLGGLALIGGLAYKAYRNYQQGQPMPTGAGSRQQPQQLLAAPDGSGFEAGAASDDQATLYIRAMIAAAAADGRIDASEQKKILGGLDQAGLDGAARQFLARELQSPATVDDLAEGVGSQEQAVQLYTAARIAIDVDTDDEHEFLSALAERLGIDKALAAHIDSAARGAAA